MMTASAFTSFVQVRVPIQKIEIDSMSFNGRQKGHERMRVCGDRPGRNGS